MHNRGMRQASFNVKPAIHHEAAVFGPWTNATEHDLQTYACLRRWPDTEVTQKMSVSFSLMSREWAQVSSLLIHQWVISCNGMQPVLPPTRGRRCWAPSGRNTKLRFTFLPLRQHQRLGAKPGNVVMVWKAWFWVNWVRTYLGWLSKTADLGWPRWLCKTPAEHTRTANAHTDRLQTQASCTARQTQKTLVFQRWTVLLRYNVWFVITYGNLKQRAGFE